MIPCQVPGTRYILACISAMPSFPHQDIDIYVYARSYTYPWFLTARFPPPGNCIITPPSKVAVSSVPGDTRMVVGECAFQRWCIGECRICLLERYLYREERGSARRSGIRRIGGLWGTAHSPPGRILTVLKLQCTSGKCCQSSHEFFCLLRAQQRIQLANLPVSFACPWLRRYWEESGFADSGDGSTVSDWPYTY